MSRKTEYLSRNIHSLSHYLGFNIGDEEYEAELQRLKIPRADWPVGPAAREVYATTTFLEKPEGTGENRKLALVTLGAVGDLTHVEIHALLAHEAVHVWQEHCRFIGEAAPSDEFEAYGVQSITLKLLRAYDARVAEKTHLPKKVTNARAQGKARAAIQAARSSQDHHRHPNSKAGTQRRRPSGGGATPAGRGARAAPTRIRST